MNQDLFEKYKSGDRKAGDLLLREQMPFIKKCVRRFTKGRCRPEDIDDVTQNAAVGLLTAIQKWDPARGAWEPFAWLWIRDALQKSIPAQQLFHGVRIPDDGEGPVLIAHPNYGLSLDAQTLTRDLPDRERRIIEGFYAQGKTLEEISQEENISRAWVKKLRDRTLDNMRKAYGEP